MGNYFFCPIAKSYLRKRSYIMSNSPGPTGGPEGESEHGLREEDGSPSQQSPLNKKTKPNHGDAAGDVTGDAGAATGGNEEEEEEGEEEFTEPPVVVRLVATPMEVAVEAVATAEHQLRLIAGERQRLSRQARGRVTTTEEDYQFSSLQRHHREVSSDLDKARKRVAKLTQEAEHARLLIESLSKMKPRDTKKGISSTYLNGLPQGTWQDMFDSDHTRFDIASAQGLAAYVDLAEASVVYADNFTEVEQSNEKKLAYQLLGAPADVVVDPQAIADSIFPASDPGKPVLSMMLFRFLITSPGWDVSLTYGQLLLTAYVIFHDLWKHHERRNPYMLIDGRMIANSKWGKVRLGFVNPFVAFIIHSFLQGPHYTPSAWVGVSEQDSVNSPVYCHFVIPILKMAKGFFPNDFNLQSVLQADLYNFPKTLKQKITQFGIYTTEYLHETLGDGITKPKKFQFLKGGFYPHFRACTLVSRAFDPTSPATRDGGGIDVKKFYIANADSEDTEDNATKGLGICPSWVKPDRRFEAQLTYTPASQAAVYRGTARRFVQPPQGLPAGSIV